MDWFKILKWLTASVFAVAAVMICCSRALAYENAIIFDETHSLSEDEYSRLQEAALSTASKTGWKIVIELDPYGDFEYDSTAFDHCVNNFEAIYGTQASGIYYYCADHYVYLATSGYTAYYFSDREADKAAGAGDNIYTQDRLGSIKLVLDAIEEEYADGRDHNPNAPPFSPLGAAAAGLLGAGIFCGISVSMYKNHEKPRTDTYINSKTVRFPVVRDIFIREYTTTHTNSSSGGSRGGGGHSGHSHSGGGHHR